MITLDSELGYALAKAKAALDEAYTNYAQDNVEMGECHAEVKRCKARYMYDHAADAVANALIAQGMHKMDGL